MRTWQRSAQGARQPTKVWLLALVPAALALGIAAEWAALQRGPLEQAVTGEEARLAVADLVVG